MTTSWFLILGEFSVLYICLYWYLQHHREREFAVKVANDSIEGLPLGKVSEFINRPFVVDEIRLAHSSKRVMHPANSTVLHHGDHLLIEARSNEIEPIVAFFGQRETATK